MAKAKTRGAKKGDSRKPNAAAASTVLLAAPAERLFRRLCDLKEEANSFSAQRFRTGDSDAVVGYFRDRVSRCIQSVKAEFAAAELPESVDRQALSAAVAVFVVQVEKNCVKDEIGIDGGYCRQKLEQIRGILSGHAAEEPNADDAAQGPPTFVITWEPTEPGDDDEQRDPLPQTPEAVLAEIRSLRAEWSLADEFCLYKPSEVIDRLSAALLAMGVGKPGMSLLEPDTTKLLVGMLGDRSNAFKRQQFDAFHAALNAIEKAVPPLKREEPSSTLEVAPADSHSDGPSSGVRDATTAQENRDAAESAEVADPSHEFTREDAIATARPYLAGRRLLIFNVLAQSKQWVHFNTLKDTAGAFDGPDVGDEAVDRQLANLRRELAETKLTITIKGMDAAVRNPVAKLHLC